MSFCPKSRQAIRPAKRTATNASELERSDDILSGKRSESPDGIHAENPGKRSAREDFARYSERVSA